ncbi:hypothetical protein NLS1_04210 [Nocardioides sp. LS1]|nr:hypothetical protein NLS1_04210 [Nocardioides sp. LS1]
MVGKDGFVTTRIPSTVPHGRTARRVEWSFLPPPVRRLVEQRLGSPVVTATSQPTGFTPGLASVLECEDGSRHFVKAASVKAQRAFAESYRTEIRKLGALPPGVPAPRLLWSFEEMDWLVLATEHVEARHPARPWRQDDLDLALDLLEDVADRLTPAPAALGLDGFATEYADWPALWDHVLATYVLPHGDEAAALAARFAEVTAGSSVVHTDVRDDNLLITADGRALLCDWNWPAAGAPWLDTLLLLIGPRGDGLDAEAVLASRRLTRDVPAEHVDIVLALLTGYFLHQADQPVPPTSPHLRDAQMWQGDVVWDWLCERRGWA